MRILIVLLILSYAPVPVEEPENPVEKKPTVIV